MSIERSRATTVSGVFDLLGRREPARSTISRTDIGTAVSRRISSTTASVLVTSCLQIFELTVETFAILAPPIAGTSLDIIFFSELSQLREVTSFAVEFFWLRVPSYCAATVLGRMLGWGTQTLRRRNHVVRNHRSDHASHGPIRS